MANVTTSVVPGTMDTSSRQGSIIAAFVFMLTLATIVVSLRFYTRRMILRILGVEDWLIVAALVFSLGTAVGFIRQTFFALGRHIWLVAPGDLVHSMMEQWYSFLFYGLSLSCTKLSILFLYRRILQHGPMRIANDTMIVIVLIIDAWVLLSQFVVCIPLQASWDPTVPGHCLGLSVQLGNSILHVLTDFAIFALPIPVLAKLKMHKKQKIGLLAVFTLGFLVCLVSIVRIISLTRLDLSVDITYDLAILGYWGAVEVNLAIICACLTTLKPLLKKLFPNLLGSSDHSYAMQYGSRTTPGAIKLVPQQAVQNSGKRDFSKLEEARDSGSTSSQDVLPDFILCGPEAQHSRYSTDGINGLTTPTAAYQKQGL